MLISKNKSATENRLYKLNSNTFEIIDQRVVSFDENLLRYNLGIKFQNSNFIEIVGYPIKGEQILGRVEMGFDELPEINTLHKAVNLEEELEKLGEYSAVIFNNGEKRIYLKSQDAIFLHDDGSEKKVEIGILGDGASTDKWLNYNEGWYAMLGMQSFYATEDSMYCVVRFVSNKDNSQTSIVKLNFHEEAVVAKNSYSSTVFADIFVKEGEGVYLLMDLDIHGVDKEENGMVVKLDPDTLEEKGRVTLSSDGYFGKIVEKNGKLQVQYHKKNESENEDIIF